MNERIKKLRQASLDAPELFSGERAEILTRFYKKNEKKGYSYPVMRGKALRYLFENKALYLGEGELIVGERGPFPKATPSYPEICTHSLDDLKTLNDRSRVRFGVEPEIFALYQDEIIPFWQDRSMRNRIFNEMEKEWKSAYEAGVFTEFQEQRAPGHTVCGDKIYREGLADWIKTIKSHIRALDYLNDPLAVKKKEEWLGMMEAAEGLVVYAGRYADRLINESQQCRDEVRQQELREMADLCRRVPLHPPQTFWEALQMYWFVHLGVITEFNTWDSFNPGRLDQHLLTFYREGIEAGSLTRERAKELLMAFWVKFNNQPAPPKVGVTAEESSTYTDFSLINVGGLTAEGEDGSNELSELILEVIGEMRLLQPSSMVQVSKKNPDRLLWWAFDVIKKGFGQPSLFNTDAIVSELVRQGKSIDDARNGGASGCVESGAFGKEAYFLSGYFNLPKVLEITLHNGIDPVTGKRIGCKSGDVHKLNEMKALLKAFSSQLEHFIGIKIKGNNQIEQLYAHFMPAPFLSLIIDDCITSGLDYHDGGARYNTTYIQGVGLGTVVDSLAAINHHVFVEKRLDLAAFVELMSKNFQGQEAFRQTLLNETPKYGNDDQRADTFVKEVFERYFQAVDGKPNSRGGVHRINLLPTTVHVYFGRKVGATPDGRLGFTPLSEGISPVQGADRNGPTAVLKSAARVDHLRTGGTLLNQKFSPSLLKTEEEMKKMISLVRSYFKMDGHHVQFNIVDAKTLKEAQKHPERYRDLIVRVAGYSDYFHELNEALQNEIIRRTEHEGF